MEFKKFIKRTLPMDAFEITALLCKEKENSIENLKATNGELTYVRYFIDHVEIQTLDEKLTANIGDYVIKSYGNELFPCTREFFLDTFIPLDKIN